jgi:hypothetical protein
LVWWFTIRPNVAEEQGFAQAVQTNTITSYTDFLAKHPEGIYADCANKMLNVVLPSNAFIRPIEVSPTSPESNYQVFCPKERIWSTIFLFRNHSPFYSALPQEISVYHFQEATDASIVKQAIVTTNQGSRQLGGDLTGVLIIDNATEMDIDVSIDTCITNMTLMDSVLSKSHLCIQLHLSDNSVDILHIKITGKHTSEVIEEFYFPVDDRDLRSIGWYVYNVGRVNSYSTLTAHYE